MIATKQNASNALTTDTEQEVTAVKTFRVSIINQAPTTSNFNVFSIGSVSGTDWYLQYRPTSKNLRWLSGKSGYPSPMQFLWDSNGKVITDFPESPTVPTPTAGDNSTLAASTAFVQAQGIPSSRVIRPRRRPRSRPNNAIATTAFVQDALAGALLTEGTPSGPTATGTKGMARFDANYFYVCTATNTWVRFAKASWT